MNNIQELITKLPAVTSVSITLFDKQQELYPMKDVIFNLQLCFYWWREAADELSKIQNSIVLSETEATGTTDNLTLPTLIGTEDQLQFLETNLKQLTTNCIQYLDDNLLPQQVQHKVIQGYNKVMDAYFSTKISAMYYEQLKHYTN